MLILQASEEQEQTFQKLIQTMGEQIVWEGRFIVKDNELILEGTVRSLFFQFETKKVVTNLIDIPVRDDQVIDVSRHPKLRDLINMVLYAFGKWGTLRGLRVEQDYPQLNQLFSKILSMYYIEPSFRKENFRFYKVGVRVTYEEVLQTVLEFEKKLEEDPAAESQGLWHTLIWKNRQRVFQKTETTLEERARNRIGNNFYLTGYQCPVCSEKLHMAVYPEGKEIRIDTEEKGVYLARVYTCENCNCFYTPRPERLIAEGFVYEMAFGDDVRAYEDYMELLGRNAQRTANFKYNEYEAVRNLRLQREAKGNEGVKDGPDYLHSAQDALKQMEDFAGNLQGLSDDVFRRFAHRIEEGFYPDAAVAKHEKKILKQVRELDARDAKKRAMERSGQPDDAQAVSKGAGSVHGDGVSNSDVLHNGHRNSGKHGNSMAGMQSGKQHGGYHETGSGLKGRNGNGGMQNSVSGRAVGMKAAYDGVADTGMKSAHGVVSDAEMGMDAVSYGSNSDKGMGTVSSGSADNSRGYDGGSEKMRTAYDGGHGTDSYAAQDNSSAMGTQPDVRWHGTLAGGSAGTPGTGNSAGQDGYGDEEPVFYSENLERYRAKMGVLERLSQRQRAELKRQIKNDGALSEQERNLLNSKIAELEFDEQSRALLKKAQSGVHKSYAQMKAFIQEAEKEPYPDSLKKPFIQKLRELQKRRGEEEVKKLMETVPERLDREGYQKLEQKLKSYEGIGLSPYKERLRDIRNQAEKQEIANIVKRSRKINRTDYTQLMHRLEEKEFADETVTPYMEKIQEKVRQIDEERIQQLLDEADQTDFNSMASVYEQLDAESFLPELKNDAMEMISKRLEKIRTDECELLVHKLQDEMEGKIKDNARHYFYPARKVMLKRAEPEETRAIDCAMDAYAGGRSRFEYPVFMADTSRNHSGREGMLLTPENLFYSTRLNAFQIPVASIDSIEASTGLLNRRITLEEADGTKHKLPYAVGTGEMEDWAQILEEFIHYLQEKPASRKLPYLAKETHDTICCYRCGYIYRERDVCPECGYKKNR